MTAIAPLRFDPVGQVVYPIVCATDSSGDGKLEQEGRIESSEASEEATNRGESEHSRTLKTKQTPVAGLSGEQMVETRPRGVGRPKLRVEADSEHGAGGVRAASPPRMRQSTIACDETIRPAGGPGRPGSIAQPVLEEPLVAPLSLR